MNKIEKMIKELCPNGVEWEKLGDILDYEQPSKYIVKSTEYRISFRTPVLTAGQSFILGYTDEIDGIFQASKGNPVIIFDDFTTSFHWVDFDFKVKSSAMKMLRMKSDKALFRYVYLYMQTFSYVPMDHSRQWIGTYSDFEIPLPPLPIQTEIVRILDKFVEQQEQLERLIELRKKQYEYYREEMLKPKEGEKWERKKLGEIGKNLDYKRKPITSSKRIKGSYPYYGASGIVDYVEDYIFDGTYLLISEDGANLIARSTPIAFTIEGKNWVNNHAHVLEINDYNVRRLVEIYLNSISLEEYISGGAQPKLNQENLNKISIPIPSKNRLPLIIEALDSFESSIAALTLALESSRRRYEYYRDEMMRF